MNKTVKLLSIIILTSLLSSSITFWYENNKYDNNISLNKAIYIKNILSAKSLYSERITNENISEGLAAGMASSVEDIHTIYIPKKSADYFNENISGEFAGIGAELEYDSVLKLPKVISPIKGGAAEEYGIKPGDIITKVDGNSTSGKHLNDIVQQIRGKANTIVNLEILRNGKYEEYKIKRKIVHVQSVEYKILKNNILYLSISSFDEDTGEELSNIINNNKSKIENIILDLRNNPGGYMESAIEVLGELLPRNQVAVVRKWNNGQEITKTDGLSRLSDKRISLIVIINKGSASASEIVAGALKDHNRATIIGEKSYGKGTVQEVIPITGGGLLKVTTSEWYTPKNITINEEGISPDVDIENINTLTEEEIIKNSLDIINKNYSK